jgi:hypothetical protein
MNKGKSVALIVFLTIGTTLVTGVYLLFHGYLDHGRFEIKDAAWSSSTQVAVLGKRSDREALNGDQYFVVIGDHLPSVNELREAYYRGDVIFRADRDCLALRWTSSQRLSITCVDHSIEPAQIAVEQHQKKNVTIVYDGIPLKE